MIKISLKPKTIVRFNNNRLNITYSVLQQMQQSQHVSPIITASLGVYVANVTAVYWTTLIENDGNCLFLYQNLEPTFWWPQCNGLDGLWRHKGSKSREHILLTPPGVFADPVSADELFTQTWVLETVCLRLGMLLVAPVVLMMLMI